MDPRFRRIGLGMYQRCTQVGVLDYRTEVGCVGIKHRQSNKLLRYLRPTGDYEPEEIAALKDSPRSLLFIALGLLTLLCDGGCHDSLSKLENG